MSCRVDECHVCMCAGKAAGQTLLGMEVKRSERSCAMACIMQAFGLEHPAVAMSLQTLASVLRLWQRLPEARQAVERCVAIRRSNPAIAKGLQAAAALYLHVSC
jgi:hypothetical protein